MVTAVQVKNTISAIKNVAQSVVPAVSRTAATKPAAALPEFLYHFTSETPLRGILSSGKLKISSFETASEALPAVYMVDKCNFFMKWLGKKYSKLKELIGSDSDLGELLLAWTAKSGGGKIVSIKIPVAQLDKSKLRFRPYISACEETVSSIEQYGKIKSDLVSRGLSLSDLPKYIAKEPVEYAYTQEIPVSLFADINSLEITESMSVPQIAKSLLV